MKNSNYYKNLSKYQRSIVDEIIKGATLKCTEGPNYKTWLKFPDGSTGTVNRNSVAIITGPDSYQFLSFTNDGIKLK